MNRCRICGHEGYDVTRGIYQLKSGKFVDIYRCVDHDACSQRKAAL